MHKLRIIKKKKKYLTMELQADDHTVVSSVCHMKVTDCGSSDVKGTVNNLQFALPYFFL